MDAGDSCVLEARSEGGRKGGGAATGATLQSPRPSPSPGIGHTLPDPSALPTVPPTLLFPRGPVQARQPSSPGLTALSLRITPGAQA